MILVDSSAWVEFDRGTASAVDERLAHLIEHTDLVATTEPIIMKVTAGARNEARREQLLALLQRFELLRFDTPTDFSAASHIYRACRSQGVTPRGIVDCMIASVALRTHASLLCQDADLMRIGQVMGIDLDPASS